MSVTAITDNADLLVRLNSHVGRTAAVVPRASPGGGRGVYAYALPYGRRWVFIHWIYSVGGREVNSPLIICLLQWWN